MSQRDNDQNRTNTPAGKPSQAEGEREPGEESRSRSQTESPAGKPSQAEGDRETVEQDLNEHS